MGTLLVRPDAIIYTKIKYFSRCKVDIIRLILELSTGLWQLVVMESDIQ